MSAVRICDTPNRHANAWQRGTGLVDDGTDHLCHGLRGCGSGHAEEHQGRSEQQFHGSTEMYILAQSKHLVGPILCFVRKTGAGRRFPRVVLTGLLAARRRRRASAAQPVRQVLVLQSFDRGNLSLDYFTAQLPRRTGPARRTARERRSGRRGPDRVRRRA